jgi:hypothetical protein
MSASEAHSYCIAPLAPEQDEVDLGAHADGLAPAMPVTMPVVTKSNVWAR